VNGIAYVIAVQQTGPDTANVRLQEGNPSTTDYTADLTTMKANAAGTQLTCQATVAVLNPQVSCTVNNSAPGGPAVNVVVTSLLFNLNKDFSISPGDSKALTAFLIAAKFPPLTP
jgi:hypothetical protein